VKAGETTRDGLFTLQMVSCFGLCGVAPAIMVNDDVYGNLRPEMIPAILDRYQTPGPLFIDQLPMGEE
jgi:NADH:ubiquinone oxidoreductase subunit E